MIGQAICIAGFLSLTVACLSGAQYSFNREWVALGVGLAVIGALFVVSALVTLVMLGTQVWS